MYQSLITILFAVISLTANASTITETTKPDGSRTVVTQVIDIAFSSNKNMIAIALFVLGAALCTAAVRLASQEKGSKPGMASQLSLHIPQGLSAKAFLGFPALVLIIGAALAAVGILLLISERFYTAIL